MEEFISKVTLSNMGSWASVVSLVLVYFTFSKTKEINKRFKSNMYLKNDVKKIESLATLLSNKGSIRTSVKEEVNVVCQSTLDNHLSFFDFKGKKIISKIQKYDKIDAKTKVAIAHLLSQLKDHIKHDWELNR